MRKGWVVLLAVVMVGVFALPAMADVSFFGYARVIPTYYNNFDFDKNKADTATLNEGGFASGEHIRSELRLGWKAGGDKWKIMMIAESDMIWNKNNADRSFYTTSAINPTGVNANNVGNTNSIPNAGAEFGLERAEFSYAFTPALELFAGWPISAVDIGTGGLLYGDDHPIIGFRGKVTDMVKYQLAYLSIQNTPQINVSESTIARDWRAYFFKPEFTLGAGAAKITLSPIVLFSDYRGNGTASAGGANNIGPSAKVWYYGLEGIGQFGMIKPSFEVIVSDGEFRSPSTVNIKSYAAFAGIELAVSKAFNPYVAGRYTRGDDNKNDTDAKGFVGITDIGRFTPLMGMDGNILGENLDGAAVSPYRSPLYSYAPDRAVGGNLYGGISGASSGNNPGEQILAVGAKGSLEDYAKGFSYKVQAFYIRYDKVGNLVKTGGGSVDKYVGTTADVQLMYAFSPNFSANYIFSAFFPGDGIKDQLASTADSTFASLHSLNLVWTY